MSIFGTSTRFINWVSYPFIKYFSFSYEMMMVLFAWFGFIGFVYFYIFFKENLRVNLKFQGYDLVTILLFLPNMHFWTASLGKGSIIFMGIGMMTYAIPKLKSRLLIAAIGFFFTYFNRPHIAFAMILATGIGFVLGRDNVSKFQKYLVAIVGLGLSFFLYENVLSALNIDTENVVDSFTTEMGANADRLTSSSGSAVDMKSYPLPLKLFTFWFRPLFIDAPNALGLFVSLENLFYLFLFIKIFDKSFLRFIRQAPAVVKMSAVMFASMSFAMTFVMSNLGIIIRQKSMIMYFMFFVILAFMDWKQRQAYQQRMRAIQRMEERNRRMASLQEAG